MRKKYLILFLFLSCSIYPQTSDRIYTLEKKKLNINAKIVFLNDSIKKIDLLIDQIKIEENSKKDKDSLFYSVIISNAIIYKKPSPFSDVVLTLSNDSNALLFDYSNGYFGVCLDSVCGYVNGNWIKTTPALISFMGSNIRSNYDKENNDKENTKKYGKTTYERLKKGLFWLGMTKDMAIISLGIPQEINRTIGSWGIHEQWVYKDSYYYFENGKMTSYQK